MASVVAGSALRNFSTIFQIKRAARTGLARVASATKINANPFGESRQQNNAAVIKNEPAIAFQVSGRMRSFIPRSYPGELEDGSGTAGFVPIALLDRTSELT